jgi:hypothetical protein
MATARPFANAAVFVDAKAVFDLVRKQMTQFSRDICDFQVFCFIVQAEEFGSCSCTSM